MAEETLVTVKGVSKKFCRTLRRSLLYGFQDIASEITGHDRDPDTLRKNEFWAVKDISFELKSGECLGLIGPNGAGKSTLLKMLNGLIKPDKGSISMKGDIGALIELGAGFNPILTARENIFINGSVLGFKRKEIQNKFDEIVDFAELHDFVDTPVQNFSSGMKVRLGFAVAANLEPHVLLIDEVLAVGDVGFRMKCFSHVLQLKSAGTALILVSHSMIDIARICTSTLVVSNGRLAFEGPVAEGISNYEKVSFGMAHDQNNGVSSSSIISSVTVLKDDNSPCTNFETGENLVVRIKLQSEKHIENVRLRLAIQSASRGHIAGFSSAQNNVDISLSPPSNCIYVTLPNIPLLVGHYLVGVGLYGAEITDVISIREAIAEFNIVGPPLVPFGYGKDGLLNLEHHWSVE